MNWKVLIADDEAAVREGLKTIIDWNACGFEICGEASNGIEVVQKTSELNPDLIMLDVKMPKMNGIDAAKQLREAGYSGSIIILSGYSDFSFAQSAISSGVDYYLLKPIDEDELILAVTNVRKKLENKHRQSAYLARAKNTFLADIIRGISSENSDVSSFDFSLSADAYQVAIIEAKENSEHEMEDICLVLKRLLCSSTAVDMAFIHERGVFLIKGLDAIKKLPSIVKNLEKYTRNENSPPIFIAAGRIVDKAKDIPLSYEDALSIDKKRFFCDENQQYVSHEILKLASGIKESNSKPDINKYADELLGYIEASNTDEIGLAMGRLYDDLRFVNLSPESIRSFLSNIYIRIKTKINENHKHLNIHFLSDEEIISTVCGIPLLYKILQYLKGEFLRIAEDISASSAQSSINKVINYVNRHYHDSLKLETLAKTFGYNSTYLGKAFKNATGEAFNLYIEKLRVEEAKKLLLTNLKVYEIAEKTGFKDIDSFYKKFKRNTGKSPGDYRKEAGVSTSE
ncbi:MAG: response regulator [Oscillospiraceae bacterium]|nr:response regulator [Oscillospiraceae bacterium]